MKKKSLLLVGSGLVAATVIAVAAKQPQPCFAGTWNITESNPYSGYFKAGSKAQIIVRASAAVSHVNQGSKRAFAIAGKLFPTDDPTDPRLLKTANFFTVDNLGGSYIPNFRGELRLENNGGELVFDIFVTSEGVKGQTKGNWQKIGFIELTEDSLSLGCDRRLHFNHPVWKNDLRFTP